MVFPSAVIVGSRLPKSSFGGNGSFRKQAEARIAATLAAGGEIADNDVRPSPMHLLSD